MAVETHLYAVSLGAFRSLAGGGDASVADRLESRWFGERAIAEEERKPDRKLIQGLVREGKLYDELDDETALRLDKMIMVVMETELSASLQSFRPMRDDLQLLVRAVRAAGNDDGLAALLDHLANGRRFGGGDAPIDVPHYAYLEADELASLERSAGRFLEACRPQGFLKKLLGGRPPISETQQVLLAQLRGVAAGLLARKSELFSVNRDPAARFDMA